MHIEVRVDGKSRCEINEPTGSISTLNLDVTTMMAFVSALTCESCDWQFSQPILSEQAQRERLASTKAFLDRLFLGKTTHYIYIYIDYIFHYRLYIYPSFIA